MSKNKNIIEPVKKLSMGCVTGSVFVNEDEESGNKWYSVNIQKFYNSSNKKNKVIWSYTTNYNVVDLPFVNLISIELLKWCAMNKLTKSSDDEE